MRPRTLSWCSVVFVLLASQAVAADPVKSGAPPGSRIPSLFYPKVVFDAQNPSVRGGNVNFICRYAHEPIVMLLAREVNDNLGALLKKLDAEVAANKTARLRVFVVLLSAEHDAVEKQLHALLKKEQLTRVSLAMEAGTLKTYQLADDADLTVLLCRGITRVEANHAFRKGELDDKAMGRILADVDRIAGFGISGRLRADLGVAPGASHSLTFTVNRRRYQGPVTLTITNLPEGITAREVTIPADRSEGVIEFAAARDFPEIDYTFPMKVTARAGPTTDSLPVSIRVNKFYATLKR